MFTSHPDILRILVEDRRATLERDAATRRLAARPTRRRRRGERTAG